MENFVCGILSFIVLGVVGTVVVRSTQSYRGTLPDQVKLFWCAYAIRFALSVVLYTTSLQDSILGESDHIGWFRGMLFVQEVDDSPDGPLALPRLVIANSFGGTNAGYGVILGFYFYFTRLGCQLAAATVVGCCGALTAVFAYRLARLNFSDWVAWRAGWWVCLFPGMIIWSAQTSKEGVVILLEVLALYSCLQLRLNRTSVRHILLCGASVFMLLSLRFYAAYLCIGVILVSLLLPQIRRGRSSMVSAAAASVVLLVPLYLMSGSLTLHTEAYDKVANVAYLGQFRDAVSTGQGSGSGVKTDHDLGTSAGLGLATAEGVVYLLLAPFPWQLLSGGSLRMLLTAPEMILWWYLVIAGVIPGLLHAARHRLGDLLPVILFVAGLGLVYSLMFGNVGLIYRQRSQLLPYLFAFAAYGIERRRERRRPAGATVGHGTLDFNNIGGEASAGPPSKEERWGLSG